MTRAARERGQVRFPLLVVGGGAWLLLVSEPGDHAMAARGSSSALIAGWALMLAAMMTPLLIEPVRYVRDRSFARRRPRAVTLFLIGYATVWTAVGAVLEGVSAALPPSGLAVAAAVLVAIGWQCSPGKQRCLNRVCRHPPLAAFGTAADIGALRFGCTHAAWCVGSCWALMLLPLVVSSGRVVVMAAVTSWLIAERLDRPTAPSWRPRVPAAAARLAVTCGRTWSTRR